MVSGSVVISSLELHGTWDACIWFLSNCSWDSPKYYLITYLVCLCENVCIEIADSAGGWTMGRNDVLHSFLIRWIFFISCAHYLQMNVLRVTNRIDCLNKTLNDLLSYRQIKHSAWDSLSIFQLIFLGARRTRSCEWNQNAKHFLQCSTNDHYCWLNLPFMLFIAQLDHHYDLHTLIRQ